MPINVRSGIPAQQILEAENIFVLTEDKAIKQDIRPLRIAILNLMPLKIETETHLLRMLSNTPLQVEIDFYRTGSYEPKNTPLEHLNEFYRVTDDLFSQKYDGMIITGAPVEQIEFTEVTYWEEMTRIFDWASNNVTSTLFICWAAQAGLYHHYGVKKIPLEKKMFGVFNHEVTNRRYPIVRGFDDCFLAPHSRHTGISKECICSVGDLKIIAESPEAGAYLIASETSRRIFVTGHAEYDPNTLKNEYERDIRKGYHIEIPRNYFPYDDPTLPPMVRWRSHASLLFSNWLNYYVYQETQYDIHSISGVCRNN